MATIGSLVIDLKAETAAFRRDLGRARRDVNRFASRTNRSLTTINRGFATLGRSAKGFIAAFAATAGVRGIQETLRSVADLADSAEKLGLSAERLQELRFAAEQNSIPINRLDTAMQRFTRRIGEARLGSGELVNTLRQYGIAVTDADGRTRSTAAVLGDLAEVVRLADSDTERLRISFKAFDSEGASLVNILRNGRDGLEAWTRQAQDAGAVMDEQLVKRARTINREWTRLTTVIGVQAKGAIIQFATVIREAFTGEPLARTAEGIREELQRINDDLVVTFDTLEDARDRNRGGAFDALVESLERQLQTLKDARTTLRQELAALEEDSGLGGVGGTGGPIDTAAQDRIQGVTEDLRFQAEQLSRTTDAQRLYNELRRAQVDLDSAGGQEIARLVAAIQAQEQAQRLVVEVSRAQVEASDMLIAENARLAKEHEQSMETIRRSSERAFGDLARDILSGENAMEGLANAARRTVDAIVSEFLRLAVIRPLIAGIFGGFGGGAGPQFTGTGPVGLASSGSFQHGGSFIADGPGGTDAIAARLDLSKGERVTVETPAQQREASGGGMTINQNFNIRGSDASDFGAVQRLMAEMREQTVATVLQLMNDGGSLAIASGRRR